MAGPTNTQFALGVHMLTLLAGSPDESLSSERMSGSAGSNPVHARRVLGQLRRVGLVASRSGPNGGWQLLRDPGTITLADVWRAVHGDDQVLGLHGANPDCTVGRRIQDALTTLERRAADAVEDELRHVTVEDLARQTAAAELKRVG